MVLIVAIGILAITFGYSKYLKNCSLSFKVFYIISLASVLIAIGSYFSIGGFEALGISYISIAFGLGGIVGMLINAPKNKSK